MAVDVVMPALGMAQETGTLVRWLKREGEAIAKGEPLMEVETDKVVVEVEATAAGILADVSISEGEEVPVGQVIARILSVEEARSAAATPRRSEVGTSTAASSTQSEPTAPQVGAGPAWSGSPTGKIPASPKARRLAAEQGLTLGAVAGSGPQGAVLAGDVLTAAARPGPPAESLRAAGTEPRQAPARPVRLADSEPYSPGTPGESVGGGVAPVGSDQGELSAHHEQGLARVPAPGAGLAVPRAWRVMAERTVQSWTSVPQFSLVREVLAEGLVEMRSRLADMAERRGTTRPTYTDLLVKMAATALRRHPRLNGSWAEGDIRLNEAINVGVAVATADALLVPVIRGADALSIGEIAARRADLVQRAHAGALAPADLADGTFTLTNLGMYGVDSFTAIVNPPQAAILALGRVADRIVPVNGEVVIKPTVVLTLTCDHRVADGARGAEFLRDLADFVEEPWALLV